MRNQKIYLDKTKRELFVENMVAGIGWGVGTILGAVMLFTVVGLIVATRIETIPFIGEFIFNILKEIQQLQGR